MKLFIQAHVISGTSNCDGNWFGHWWVHAFSFVYEMQGRWWQQVESCTSHQMDVSLRANSQKTKISCRHDFGLGKNSVCSWPHARECAQVCFQTSIQTTCRIHANYCMGIICCRELISLSFLGPCFWVHRAIFLSGLKLKNQRENTANNSLGSGWN